MPQLKMEQLRRIQSETCKIFGNPKRLLILETIWDGRMSNRLLRDRTGLDKVTLAQQTTLMRRKGILTARQTPDGLVFEVTNPKILKAFSLMRETVIDKIKEDSELITDAVEAQQNEERD